MGPGSAQGGVQLRAVQAPVLAERAPQHGQLAAQSQLVAPVGQRELGLGRAPGQVGEAGAGQRVHGLRNRGRVHDQQVGVGLGQLRRVPERVPGGHGQAVRAPCRRSCAPAPRGGARRRPPPPAPARRWSAGRRPRPASPSPLALAQRARAGAAPGAAATTRPGRRPARWPTRSHKARSAHLVHLPGAGRAERAQHHPRLQRRRSSGCARGRRPRPAGRLPAAASERWERAEGDAAGAGAAADAARSARACAPRPSRSRARSRAAGTSSARLGVARAERPQALQLLGQCPGSGRRRSTTASTRSHARSGRPGASARAGVRGQRGAEGRRRGRPRSPARRPSGGRRSASRCSDAAPRPACRSYAPMLRPEPRPESPSRAIDHARAGGSARPAARPRCPPRPGASPPRPPPARPRGAGRRTAPRPRAGCAARSRGGRG